MKLKYLFLLFAIMVNVSNGIAEDISRLRTSKKIIRMEKAVAPYYAIQIIALKHPPGVASFFRAVDLAREYVCVDGYVRYTVGQFTTYDKAKSGLGEIKALGYHQAFVVNTAEFKLKGAGNSVSARKGNKKIDPSKIYTVQVSAFRFPVYLSHFENLDNIMEFRMKDKVFRYCVGKFKGSVAQEELSKIKALGYKDAYLVELDNYLPYKIE